MSPNGPFGQEHWPQEMQRLDSANLDTFAAVQSVLGAVRHHLSHVRSGFSLWMYSGWRGTNLDHLRHAAAAVPSSPSEPPHPMTALALNHQ